MSFFAIVPEYISAVDTLLCNLRVKSNNSYSGTSGREVTRVAVNLMKRRIIIWIFLLKCENFSRSLCDESDVALSFISCSAGSKENSK